MNKSTSILKSAPFVLFIAMALAGCPGESPEEAYCNKVVQCDLGSKLLPSKGETAAQCAEGEDKAFAALDAQSACASTAEKIKDLYTCIGGQSCGDLTKPTVDMTALLIAGTLAITVPGPGPQLPEEGTPCREELQALFTSLSDTDGTSGECLMLHTLNLLPGVDFHGASGASCQKDEQCPDLSQEGEFSLLPRCLLGKCMTKEDKAKIDTAIASVSSGMGAGGPGSGAPAGGGD